MAAQRPQLVGGGAQHADSRGQRGTVLLSALLFNSNVLNAVRVAEGLEKGQVKRGGATDYLLFDRGG